MVDKRPPGRILSSHVMQNRVAMSTSIGRYSATASSHDKPKTIDWSAEFESGPAAGYR
jgi:hypothetical protein